MDSVILLHLIGADDVEEIERRECYRQQKINRRMIRDKSDVLNLPNEVFIDNFRLNKEAFLFVLQQIEPHIKQTLSIPGMLQLAACLRMFAEGGYQRAVAKDFDTGLARPTFCKIFQRILNSLEKYLCRQWINLEMSEEEIQKSKNHFYQKTGFPGVVGCVDGTHVNIIKPSTNAHLYINRKGHYSINVMIICDYTMKIRAVDATHPGSSHDAFIWSMSSAKRYYSNKYQHNQSQSWLLGDSGYALEPFLMTPYRNPISARENRYNRKHASARNIVERTIGNLKNRFRCLLGARQLHYSPIKASKIISVCCALHNICKYYKLEDVDVQEEDDTDDSENYEINYDSTHNIAHNLRNSIANNL